ncbi:type IV pilin N-terminal domain-containing protein [Natrinema sp. DC36]|uniref:type IV pilin n=1 Tax=Natrinema sp. DC36 TaxID=2878680 RepID=UPI001CEFEABA|nr:type IV pilin N-terminal domain-containing protein [Natrinema sp. DC36]
MATDTDRAVAPIIGVVLLIGLTVILAATIAAFTLDMQPPSADQVLETDPQTQDTPDVAFSFSQTRGLTTITHDGGDALDADSVTIETDGGSQVWADSGRVDKGDSRTVSGSGVRVLYEGEVLAESGA